MRLSEVACSLKAEEIVKVEGFDPNIEDICASDLLSDILSTEKEKFVILTGLTTPQVIRTAEIVSSLGIVIVRGKYPHQLVGIITRGDIVTRIMLELTKIAAEIERRESELISRTGYESHFPHPLK